MAWTACIKLQKIWNSKIPAALKRKFFKACVEPVLLYGSETWTIKKAFQDRLVSTYTRLLMKAQNLSWKKHPTKKEIYSGLPPISSVIAQRRARFAGHCMRAQDQPISTILPLRFQQTGRGRRPFTISPEEGAKWHLIQSISGDSTDGYSGVPGIGVKRAETLFNKEGYSWKTVVNAYKAKDLTEADALINARLARILTFDDYDFDKQQPKLWSPSSDYTINT